MAIGHVRLDIHTLLYAALCVLVGFQAVSFAGLSKFFALRAGLHPTETRFEQRIRATTLESGLLPGLALVVLGIGLWVGAFWTWREHGFGALNPSETLRWVIPGMLGIALGCQMVLTSFFIGVLRMDTRNDPTS